MKNNIFVGRLTNLERMHNSLYGNPKWLCQFYNSNNEMLIGKTASDSACAYSIGHYSMDKLFTVEYHVTKTGNIIITRLWKAENE